MTFRGKLLDSQTGKNSLLCIGLDTDVNKIPDCLRACENPVLEFNKRIIESTHDLVCAYKFNLAFYEAMGSIGFETLLQTLKLVPKSIITIGDGKRGDIGNTSQQYAKAFFEYFCFDAVTLNPYMGYDSIEPFLQYVDKGVFILALTSNSGSKDFQRLKIGKYHLYEKVVKTAKRWNKKDNVGLVVGATHPKELREIRAMVPEMAILIPGVGKQGGDLSKAVNYGSNKNGYLAIINMSRNIIYSTSGPDFAESARIEAKKTLEIIRHAQVRKH